MRCIVRCIVPGILGGVLRRGLSLGSALALVTACVAPTLPLPPPATPNFAAASTPGQVKLTSTNGVLPNAVVFIYNTNPNLPRDERVGGAQADGHGTWEATIWGKRGDVVDISQQDPQGEWSSPNTAQVQYP